MGKQRRLKIGRSGSRGRPTATKTTAIPGLTLSADGETVNVASWAQPAPEVEYLADSCEAVVESGWPTLYFGQHAKGQRLTTYGVAMAPARIKEMVDSFAGVRSKLPDMIKAWPEAPQPSPLDLSGLEARICRKVLATFVRGACSQDLAMMDFYRISPLPKEQLAYPLPPDFVSAKLRVMLSPPLFAFMFVRMEENGLVQP